MKQDPQGKARNGVSRNLNAVTSAEVSISNAVNRPALTLDQETCFCISTAIRKSYGKGHDAYQVRMRLADVISDIVRRSYREN
jgi:hypothetical protein